MAPEDALELLTHHLKNFESRPQQVEMMQTVIQAYQENAVALIEAGTGTGKSIAYLIPALLWAIKNNERTVISTNTINLQEQLINKDLPVLLKALNLNVKASLVKGMGNYLCFRKLNEAIEEKQLLSDNDVEELEKIEAWAYTTSDGSKSDLPITPSYANWDRVRAESDLCNQRQCPHYQQCHFIRARNKASDAQILFVNHHLLFADLALDKTLLPPYQRLVIDEAHHIEEIATEYFADRVHYIGFIRALSRLASERGKLSLLREKIAEHTNPPRDLLTKLSIDFPGMRREVHHLIGETFQAYSAFMNEENDKMRLLPKHYQAEFWQSDVLPVTKELIKSLYRYIHSLNGLQDAIDDEKLQEKTKNILFDINSYTVRLNQMCKTLETFIQETIPENAVRWMEGQQMNTLTNVHLVQAKLDVSESMAKLLFDPLPTTILCSATLATNRSFNYIKSRIGLKDQHILEAIYDSSFNYQKQALLAVPTDICDPTDPDFAKQVQEHIWEAIKCSRGNAFILFTSYGMLKLCYNALQEKLTENHYFPLKQGDQARDELLSTFRTTDRSVLFGTDSFWEGVDVAGEALRLVIIVRLPFQVPSEPIIQARTEAIKNNGKNPFYEHTVPNAIVKFKQGFGRLIRNKTDRGCILCLDKRLLTKPYGKLFLQSLPQCQQAFAATDELHKKMEDFYRSTYHLT